MATNPEINQQFFDIVVPQVNSSIADTLCNFLYAVVNQGGVSESAVKYTLSKLWTADYDPRTGGTE